MDLFRASTDVIVGVGAKFAFMHDSLLPGGALKMQFPKLFQIATRKQRRVQKELMNIKWIRSLANISTTG